MRTRKIACVYDCCIEAVSIKGYWLKAKLYLALVFSATLRIELVVHMATADGILASC